MIEVLMTSIFGDIFMTCLQSLDDQTKAQIVCRKICKKNFGLLLFYSFVYMGTLIIWLLCKEKYMKCFKEFN